MASQTVVQNSSRVITRERGVIPGCIPAGRDNHMAVDKLGRPWTHSPSDADAYLAKLRADIDASQEDRLQRTGKRWLPGFEPRGIDPVTGLKLVEKLAA